MDNILTENVLDSRLESCNDPTNLFDCLATETMNDDHVEKRTTNTISIENGKIVSTLDTSDETDPILKFIENTATNTLHAAQSTKEGSIPIDSLNTDTSSVNVSDSDKGNDFIPTIVDIRGACDNSIEPAIDAENTSTELLPQIGDVQGGIEELDYSNDQDKNEAVVANDDFITVHTIDDSDDTCDDSAKPDALFNANVVIKQEPRDEDVDNDCMLIESDDVSTCFTSEIEIKEERPENEDSEVLCIETCTEIPLPIPIKIEANFKSDKEVKISEVLCVETCTEIPSPIPIKIEANFENDKEVKISEVLCSETWTEIPSPIPIKIEANSENDKKVSKSKSPVKEVPKVTTTGTAPDTKSTSTKLYTTVGYTCHLCNTTFQEHELLNEHMKLHRNNSLVERFNKTYTKHRKHVKYLCRTCGKRLSTGQSLAQHMMIHNNEKPHVCPICKKDFRHLSNFKMHVQKHKEEEEQRRKQREKHKLFARLHPPPADRSIARGADFGRLVGPLFVKETLLSKNTSEISRPMITPKVERKPFELKFPKARENAKENLIFFKKTNPANYDEPYSRARKFNDDIGDDVIPLKTFNNVENIVMNATKFIVKVDNLDANLLKKKIKTPDISIDKSAAENRPPDRKRRVALSPSDSKKLKLDQIENIIMDDSPQSDNDFDYTDDRIDYDDYVSTANKQETLTDNELFELLNDDKPDIVSIPQTPAKSNVIVLKSCTKSYTETCEKPLHKVEPPKVDIPTPKPKKEELKLPEKQLETDPIQTINLDDEDDEEVDVSNCDMYDNAFRNVALRRLTLIRKKAAQNGGKVENKYLLGPLFWRKALQKAQKNQLGKEPPANLNEAKMAYKRLNNATGKIDTRRTNDPAKLQQRAELKLQFVLDRIKLMTDVSHVNIAGPLFWKRTLKLAGVHTSVDLKRLLANERLSINDVKFIDTEEIPEMKENEINGDTVVIDDEPLEPPSKPEPVVEVPKPVVASDFLETVPKVTRTPNCNIYASSNDKNIVDSILNDDLLTKKPLIKPPPLPRVIPAASSSTKNVPSQVLKTSADSTKELDARVTKAESILYDSLTKPRPVLRNELARPKIETQKTQTVKQPRNRPLPSVSTSKPKPVPEPKPTPRLIESQIPAVTTSSMIMHEIPDSTTLEGGNIILNVDSADFQLIADSKEENGEETNYVLVTDENGGVQLIKENDLQLVEDEANNTQYVVNMQGENFPNFDLMGNSNGEQLTYTIQLDGGGNYTTLQFVQDGDSLEPVKEKIVSAEKSVNIGGTNYVIADANTDLNHIGKELSDFLHIDYGTLLKNENDEQQG